MDALLPSALLEKPLEEYEEGEAAIAFLLELFLWSIMIAQTGMGKFSPQNWMGFQTVKFGDRKKSGSSFPPKCFPDLITDGGEMDQNWMVWDQECPKLTNKNPKQNPTTGSFPFF